MPKPEDRNTEDNPDIVRLSREVRDLRSRLDQKEDPMILVPESRLRTGAVVLAACAGLLGAWGALFLVRESD